MLVEATAAGYPFSASSNLTSFHPPITRINKTEINNGEIAPMSIPTLSMFVPIRSAENHHTHPRVSAS